MFFMKSSQLSEDSCSYVDGSPKTGFSETSALPTSPDAGLAALLARPCRKVDSRIVWEDPSMTVAAKILIVSGGLISAVISIWLIICIFGMWFIGPPRDLSITLAHDILWRAGMSALFLGISVGLGFLSRGALRMARASKRS